MDLLRHVGRGKLTSFAGGAPGNRALEQSVWRNSPYTEADLQAQIDALQRPRAPGAQQLYADVQRLHRRHQRLHRRVRMADRNCPGEYVLTGHLDAITNAGGPEHFTHDRPDRASPAWSAGCSAAAAAARCSPRWSGSPPGPSTAPPRATRSGRPSATQNDPEAVLTLHNGAELPVRRRRPAGATGVALPDARHGRPPDPLVYDATGTGHRRPAGTSASAAAVLTGRPSTSAKRRACPTPSWSPAAQLGHRPPDRRLRPADRLLRPAAAHAPGAAGPGHQRARRRLRRAQPLRAARPRPGLRLERHLRRPGHHRHLRRPLCDTDGSTPTIAADHYLYHGICTADGEARADQLLEADRRRRHRRRLVPTASSSAPSYGLVHLARHGRRQADRLHHAALDLPARGRLGDRLPDVQRPGRDGRRRRPSTSSAQQHRLRVQLVLRQLHPRGVLQLRRQPGARRRRPTRTCRCGPSAAYEWAGCDPATNTATYTPPSAHPQLGRPGLLRQLEQQAGQGLRRGRRQLQLRRGAPRPTCWTTGSRRPLAGRREARPGRR